jgi:Raf kinase inhibitor-like YbhB/YbcL family protein
MAFTLSSPAFAAGQRIPVRFTCEGADASPPLAWSGAPAATRGFALVCADPDAPAGTWYHWAAYDIPPATASLGEGLAAAAQVDGLKQAVTDFRRPGYGGPCPPKGHGTHRYFFRLYALKVASLGLPAGAPVREVEKAAKANALAEAALMGIYSR